MSQAAKFKAMLKSGKMIVAPGAIDCITGKLIEQAGFEAAYMTGAGTSATLGYPDYGLVTMSEMAENAGRIAAAVKVPVIADAWPHPYTREQAAYPAPWVKDHKFWPAVGRIDNPFGDRNLVCACPPVDTYQS